jgi:hypothetical protein
MARRRASIHPLHSCWKAILVTGCLTCFARQLEPGSHFFDDDLTARPIWLRTRNGSELYKQSNGRPQVIAVSSGLLGSQT